MSDIDGPGEGSESPPPEPQRGGNRGLSGSAKVREVCLKEEKKIFRAIQKSLFAIEDCQKKECGHEPLGKVKLPEFVGFLIQPTGEIVTLLTGMWKQGARHDRVQQFEFDLMALWNMYINSFPPDDERFLEHYDVVLTDDGTLGQLIKEMKHKELEAVKSLYKCQGLSDVEAEEQSRKELGGHPDYQSCQGDGCATCNKAREFLNWPTAVPFVYPSRLRSEDKKVVVDHYKSTDPENWARIQGKSTLPVEAAVTEAQMACETDDIMNQASFRDLLDRFVTAPAGGAPRSDPREDAHAGVPESQAAPPELRGSIEEQPLSSAPEHIYPISDSVGGPEDAPTQAAQDTGELNRPRKRGRPKKVRRGRPPKARPPS